MTESATHAQPNPPTQAGEAGNFVWYDLMTTDLPRSAAFYSALFGWERRSVDAGPAGQYDMLFVNEYGIGGMVPLDPAAHVPSHWIPYISVDDVDTACATAAATGGTTCVPPTDIPDVGRFAVVQDPQGALFSPFTSSSAPMPEPAKATSGTFAWNELMTTDPQKAGEFYAGVTGWTIDRMDMGATGYYWLFRRGAVNAAGMAQMPGDLPSRPHWLPAIAVESCDAAAVRATELGGTVVVRPTDIQEWGRFAVALDPTGAAFTMLENKRPM